MIMKRIFSFFSFLFIIRKIKSNCPSPSQYILENTSTCVEREEYPDYYIENNILKKCFHPCYECSGPPDDNDNLNCLSCLRGYEYDSVLNKCVKCPKNKYKYIYTSYDSCLNSNEKFCKKEKTKCTVITDKIFKGCPLDIPILIESKKMCVEKKICNETDYSNHICKVSNIPLIEKQKLNPIYFPSDKELINNKIIDVFLDYYGNILFEASNENDNKRYYYGIMLINGRENFTNENGSNSYETILRLNETIRKFTSNIICFNQSSYYAQKYFIGQFVYEEELYIEVISFDSEDNNSPIIYIYKFIDILSSGTYKTSLTDLKIISIINPVYYYDKSFSTYIFGFIGVNSINEYSLFIYEGLGLRHFKMINKDDFSIYQDIEISVSKYERISFFKVGSERIFILYLDKNLNLKVGIHNFTIFYRVIKDYIDIIIGKSFNNNYFSCFHLTGQTGVYIYYSEENSKLTLSIKTYDEINKNFSDFIEGIPELVINSDEKYPISFLSKDNEAILINQIKFSVISKYINNESILIMIFKILNDNDNNYKSIKVNYYELSLIENDIKIIDNFKLFSFKDLLGIYFYNEKKLFPGFMLFGYANSIDPEPIENLFNKIGNYTIKFKDYIKLENNIFGYEFKFIKVLSKPDSTQTGIYLFSSDFKEIYENDTLDYNDFINIAHFNGFILPGEYEVSLVPIVTEPTSFSSYNFFIDYSEIFGEDITNKGEYYLNHIQEFEGRVTYFNFTIEDDNSRECSFDCDICYKDQCFKCFNEGTYPIENLDYCSSTSPGNQFYFNTTINVYLLCHETCKTCDSSYDESTDNHNCLECKDGYIKMKGTKNCYDENENITGYVKYEKDGELIFYKCNEHCETCFAPLSNQYYYNCLTCDAEDNYILFNKSHNCLYCYYINKIANYEQTKCIFENQISNGYYLEKNRIVEKCYNNCLTCSNGPIYQDMDKKIILNMSCDLCDNENEYFFVEKEKGLFHDCYLKSDIPNNFYKKYDEINNDYKYYQCYELCSNCSERGTDSDMKCDSCLNNIDYEFVKGNCYQSVQCLYYFFRNITNNNNKECLEKGKICLNDYPFLLENNKECLTSCSFEQLIDKICISTKFPKALEKVHEIIIEKIKTNEIKLDNNKEFNDIIIKGKEVLYRLTTNINENNIDINNAIQNYSFIDFRNCEMKLKDNNKINENDVLFFLMINIERNDTPTTQVEYEIYNSNNLNNNLDLSTCIDSSISLYSPIFLTEAQFKEYKNAKNQGYDIYKSNDSFYNDICTPFNSLNNVDVIQKDRIMDYYNNTILLCESTCEYGAINVETKKVKCTCNVKNKTNLLNYFSDIKFEPNEILGNFYTFIQNSNIKLLKCYALVFNIDNLKANIGSYFMLFLILSFLISLIYGLISFKKNINNIFENIIMFIKNIIEVRKIRKKKKSMSAKVIKKDISYPPIKKTKKAIEHKNITYHNSINIFNFNNNNDKTYKKLADVSRHNEMRCSSKKNTRKSNKSLNSKYSKLRKQSNISNRLSDLDCTLKNMNSNMDRKNIIKSKFIDKNFDSKKVKIKNYKGKKDSNLNMNYINTKDSTFERLIKKIEEKERYKYLIDDELNYLSYEYAIQIDNRTCSQYYFSLLKTKNLIFFAFFNKHDYNLYTYKICLFICIFAIYFTVNGIFYTDNTMHTIYKNNGTLDLIYQIPKLLVSSLICSITSIILKELSLLQRNILMLKYYRNSLEAKKEAKKIYSSVKIKFGIFSVFGIILLLFCWYYISAFCSVYKNTQIHLIKSLTFSFFISMAYSFGLIIIPVIMRIPSLRNKKDKKLFYNISKFISYML